ncbi:MAG: polysaccharide deacetylase family protein [Candidatus Omnitrophota bacterium]
MKGIGILLYHSVGRVDPRDTLGIRIDEDGFFEQMRSLKERDYSVLTLKDAVSLIAGNGEAPERAVVITFDDGYKDNLVAAAPVLERFGFRATFFVTTGYIGSVKTSPKREWRDGSAWIIETFLNWPRGAMI